MTKTDAVEILEMEIKKLKNDAQDKDEMALDRYRPRVVREGAASAAKYLREKQTALEMALAALKVTLEAEKVAPPAPPILEKFWNSKKGRFEVFIGGFLEAEFEHYSDLETWAKRRGYTLND